MFFSYRGDSSIEKDTKFQHKRVPQMKNYQMKKQEMQTAYEEIYRLLNEIY